MSVGATNLDAVRRTNLGRILRTLHLHGGHSRAQLTRLTGLNRSTVAALIAELTALGLVAEADATAARNVGRPSPIASVTARPVALAVHAEIDAVEIAAVGLGGAVHARVRAATGGVPSRDGVVDLVGDLVTRLRPLLPADALVLGMGVAVPGLVRAEDGLVRLAPGLGWREEPLGAALSVALALPVRVENDASLAARAERDFGAGRGIDDLIYVNGGASGIGGGIILGGAPIRGAGGYAGEFGHAFGSDDGRELEHIVTRDALCRAAGLAADADDAELAAQLRSAASAVPVDQARVLGRALAGMANILNPSRIVLGGFLAVLADVAGDELGAAFAERALGPIGESCDIRPAQLAENRLVIGAAEPVFDALCADPAGLLAATA